MKAIIESLRISKKTMDWLRENKAKTKVPISSFVEMAIELKRKMDKEELKAKNKK